jgi:DNA replication licensing factor MCM5
MFFTGLPILVCLQNRPDEALSFFGAAAKEVLSDFVVKQSSTLIGHAPDFQIILKSAQEEPVSLRTLTANQVNHLIKVPGIVISCTKIRAKATVVSVKCRKCGCAKVF